MKKILVLMAMAGVALAGCVNDVADVAQSKEKQKITFGTPLSYSNGSRANVAGEINNPYPIKESFTIYATEYLKGSYAGWGQDATGFNGEPAVYDSNVDGWAPKDGANYYYWTDGYDMAFAACSPHDLGENCGTKNYNEDGLTITNFIVQDDSKDQYDLMFSKRIYDKNASHLNKAEGEYSGIQLTFQHALSSIHFSILNETLLASESEQHVRVRLKSITISGVHNKGTFTENIDEGSQGGYNKNYDKGDGGNVNPNWSEDTESFNTSPYVAYYSGSEYLYFPSVQQYISNYINKLETETGAVDGAYGEAIPLLLLPQSLPSSACITVKYDVENKETSSFEERTKDILINELVDAHLNPLTPSWEIGTKYTYRLVYTNEVAKANRIYFAPTVEDWADGGIVVIHL